MCARECISHCVKSLKNVTDEQRPPYTPLPLPQPNLQQKGDKRTHTLQQMHTAYNSCICYSLPHTQEKQFLKLIHVILLLDVNTLGFTQTHTHPHTHRYTTTIASSLSFSLTHTRTHFSLFSDKGLLFQLCHDSTKDFFGRKRGLNRDLAGDWVKALTLFPSFVLSLSLSLPHLSSTSCLSFPHFQQSCSTCGRAVIILSVPVYLCRDVWR